MSGSRSNNGEAAHHVRTTRSLSIFGSAEHREMFGIRRWLQRHLVGGSIDDEASLEGPAGRHSGACDPALAAGSGSELGEALTIARSLADKFLIRCLLDDSLNAIYSKAASRLPVLKRDLVEALLAALRTRNDLMVKPVCLQAHRSLLEEHVEQLRKHLVAAVREHFEHADGSIDVDEFLRNLIDTPGVPLALLPRQDVSERDFEEVALRSKGGDKKAGTVVGGIEFAPLHVPLKRRRQTLACVLGTGLIPGAVVSVLVCLYFWRKTWPIIVPYFTYALFIDKSPWKGGMRISRALRRSWIFQNWAEYFPATLIKANPTADFSGERPVLMGYHPHGILSFGAQLNFGTDCTGWAEKFPKLTPRVCTLNINFVMPFLRELIGRLGAIPADASAIRAALKPGNAVVLVVGGAAEALDTKPGEYVLTLARRTGFFRLALQHGADLVPTFGFGENDLFEILTPNSLLRAIQLKAYKVLSFSMPIFYGRGVFTYNMGILPYRRPLTVVVGEPIRVERTADPSKEQIEELKARYIAALRKLHEEWAPRLEPGRDASLMVL